MDDFRLLRPVVNRKIIYRADNFFPIFQVFYRLNQQVSVKRIRVVIVELAALLVRHIVMGFIIAVMVDYRHIISEPFNQLLR